MREAIAMIVGGAYILCLFMASQHPVFYDLAVFVAGVILGIVANDCLCRANQVLKETPDPFRDLERNLQEGSLSGDKEKGRKVQKLKEMFVNKIRGVDPVGAPALSDKVYSYVESLGPEVLNMYDESLWCVVNGTEDYAFRNPYDRDRTIVMRKEFAEKALVLGYIP